MDTSRVGKRGLCRAATRAPGRCARSIWGFLGLAMGCGEQATGDAAHPPEALRAPFTPQPDPFLFRRRAAIAQRHRIERFARARNSRLRSWVRSLEKRECCMALKVATSPPSRPPGLCSWRPTTLESRRATAAARRTPCAARDVAQPSRSPEGSNTQRPYTKFRRLPPKPPYTKVRRLLQALFLSFKTSLASIISSTSDAAGYHPRESVIPSSFVLDTIRPLARLSQRSTHSMQAMGSCNIKLFLTKGRGSLHQRIRLR